MRGAWYRNWILCASVLLFLGCTYVLAGIYLAPKLIRSQATEWVRVNLGKPLAIGEIKVNPIGFKVDIDDIAIPGPAEPMVAVGHLHLNFSILSLLQDAYRFDEIRVDRPFIGALIRPDGSLNLAELIPPSRPGEGPAPAFRIGTLSVNQGKIAFADHSRELKPEKTLTPITFTLENFQTNRTEGGDFVLNARSERGETFAWRGKVSIEPIASRGRFSVAGLQIDTIYKFLSAELPVTLTSGSAAFDGSYSFAYGKEGTRLNMALPKLALAGFAFDGKNDMFRGTTKLDQLSASISRIGFASDGRDHQKLDGAMSRLAIRGLAISMTGPAADNVLRLANTKLENSTFDYAARRIDLGKLTLDGLELSVRRERNGQINVMRMLPSPPGKAVAAPSTPPWNVRLGGFALTNAALGVEDRAVTPVARFDIAPITMTATGAGTDLSKPMTVRVDSRINGKASFKGEGLITPATGAADLTIALSGLPLRAVLPYMPHYPGVDVRSGDIGASGALSLAGRGISTLRFRGNASVDNFNLHERASDNALFAWRAFHLAGIDYRPDRIEIARGRLSRPFGRIAILPNGSFNYTALMTPSPTVHGVSTAAQSENTEVVKTAPAAPTAPSVPVRLKRLDIDAGTMSFADYSIQPNFGARIDALRGSITDVSNMPDAVAAIDLKGQIIDRFSPVEINGSANLLGYDRKTNVHMAFRNIELPVFNPYSGRYAGYAIAKGKLTTELTYKIDNRALNAEHHVIIDQLQWGEATDSKEKVPLPIRLATSLLKDRQGVIDLDVPVTGSLDDPKFRLGPIIWKIIGNIIVKIVTAPFSLIGSLFAGADKAQYVDFAPGSAVLPSGSAESLSALAKGLGERPALQMDIPAGPGSKEDAISIADARIDALLMTKEVKKGEPTDPAMLKVDERYDRMKNLYKTKLGKKPVFPDLPAGAFAPPADAKAKPGDKPLSDDDQRKTRESEWIRSELRKSFMPSATELAALGSARATAVRDALLADGSIDPVRIFMATGQMVTPTDGHARLELKLK